MLGDFVSWNKPGRRAFSVEEHPLSSIQRQMNRLLEDFVSGTALEQPLAGLSERFGGAFQVRLAVEDTADAITVHAELPGVQEEDFDISLTKDALTIRGEKKKPQRDKEEKDVRVMDERLYGPFERVVPLMVPVREDQVDADFSNGILVVRLPKALEGQRAKKIIIKSSSSSTGTDESSPQE